MIQRPKYLSALKEYRDIPLVKNSCGIRRCGKSTILEMLKNDLISDGVPKERNYLYAIHFRRIRCGNDR